MNFSRITLALGLLLGGLLSSGCETCFTCDCPVVIVVNGQEVPGGDKEVNTCDADEQRRLEQEDDCTCAET